MTAALAGGGDRRVLLGPVGREVGGLVAGEGVGHVVACAQGLFLEFVLADAPLDGPAAVGNRGPRLAPRGLAAGLYYPAYSALVPALLPADDLLPANGLEGVLRPVLNGSFVFQMGTLDQGYWPDGIYTAPTDAAVNWSAAAFTGPGVAAKQPCGRRGARRWPAYSTIFQYESLRTILSPRNSPWSQPRTRSSWPPRAGSRRPSKNAARARPRAPASSSARRPCAPVRR